MNVQEMQVRHRKWLEHNFPNAEPWEALAGLTEELGELAHAHLKGFRGIRNMRSRAEVKAAQIDAVGDIFIYLMSYCNSNGLSLEACIMRAWDEVMVRDWIKNPEDGRIG